ncbi:18536_t:CDS:2, partial [Racocetra fulgida]
FNLDFYTEVQDLSYLLEHLDSDPFANKFKELNKALCGLVEDFSLVGFYTLCIEGNESIMLTAMSDINSFHDVMDVQERWLDHRETWDEWETKQKQQQTGQ